MGAYSVPCCNWLKVQATTTVSNKDSTTKYINELRLKIEPQSRGQNRFVETININPGPSLIIISRFESSYEIQALMEAHDTGPFNTS